MGESRNQLVGEHQVDIKAKELAKALMESPEYKDFVYYLEKLKKQPELYGKVCDFRRRNFELQNADINNNMYDDIMRFQAENSAIRKITLVNDFLNAELSVCRMLQEVNRMIVNDVGLDIDFLNN